uniref:T-complex protein 1 subunit eta n=1 Tax=Stygiella incarcerata TaxID=1712417 RepID=A0A192ZHV3_9EUKA|nr:T-complex protein 1 subunit eta [Stygiella incarcerata]|eukprot:TRINITY_DN450_c0_g1_i1.p1 TRINITY_DN450_c0_g1~~TRINITY_DN450_c0_g1_i1.p1  ORF type:complete len:564 (-),score=174.23 TRINITY_DN450_c0_g1_i1:166-1857(-)
MSMLQPSILLLREGTDASQGRAQVVSNINACLAIVDIVKTTLGPRGMDKLIYDDKKATISNDGATIMGLLDIVHPAAKTLVDIARSQDSEVGDGTTSVVVLAGELLKEAKSYIDEGVHPQTIIRAFRKALSFSLSYLETHSISIADKKKEELRKVLVNCARTTLNSKLISGHKDFFAEMAVDAVMALDEDLNMDLIGVKKVPGGSMQDSFLVDGVAFKKTFSYAGFEQQKKKFVNPKILLLNVELELKAERENAEIRLTDPDQYVPIVEAEWEIIYSKLEKCVECGANIVLSRLPIGDLATQYFADRGMFCAGRVPEEDIRRVAKATGGSVQSTVEDIIPTVIGSCDLFEERQVGHERYNIFTGCPVAKTATVILRGGAEQFIEEADRSLHDAIMVVRRAIQHSTIVGGGGAIEMQLSRALKDYSKTIHGKAQLMVASFARALEVIPRQVADNAGFDSTDILNRLRREHSLGTVWYGVDIDKEGIIDTIESFVWEPTLVKKNAIESACEAAALILSVDETVRNPESEQPPDAPVGPPGQRVSQAGMAGLMGGGLRQLKGKGGK